MKSLKRLTALIAAVAAVVALAAPSMASASRIEASKGKLAPAGTTLTMSGPMNISSSLYGQLGGECYWTVNEQLTKNDGITVEGVPTTPGTSIGCTNNGNPMPITDIKFEKFYTSVSGRGTVNLSFTSEFSGAKPLICRWTGTGVPFTYQLGGSGIAFTSAAGLSASPGACGTGKLNGYLELKIGSLPVIFN